MTRTWFDYGRGRKREENYHRWLARYHGYMESRRDDGTLCTIPPKEAWPEDQECEIEVARTFGVPVLSK